VARAGLRSNDYGTPNPIDHLCDALFATATTMESETRGLSKMERQFGDAGSAINVDVDSQPMNASKDCCKSENETAHCKISVERRSSVACGQRVGNVRSMESQ
jgi:hypothetical protein